MSDEPGKIDPGFFIQINCVNWFVLIMIDEDVHLRPF
jgi:hypothetical protein